MSSADMAMESFISVPSISELLIDTSLLRP